MTMNRKETTVNEFTKKSWADLSESAKQNICGYYVGREVQQCVSMLVSAVLGVAGQYREVDSELETDTLQDGFCGYDYREAAEQHINDCDYPDDLLDMADEVGDRDEAMLAAGYDEIEARQWRRRPIQKVYEYWIVSDWMGRQLSKRGYLVTEWMGLTIWGRQCTGQAILLDYVINCICSELYNNNHYFPDQLLERNND